MKQSFKEAGKIASQEMDNLGAFPLQYGWFCTPYPSILILIR